jgi:hypothetical protein
MKKKLKVLLNRKRASREGKRRLSGHVSLVAHYRTLLWSVGMDGEGLVSICPEIA